MLSKIENGQISASLKTIQLICHALNISITSLFKQHDKDVEPTFIKSGEGLTIERAGSDESRHYQLLGHNVSGSLKVEPCLITVTSRDYDFPDFQHKGIEFIYMLKGEMDYFEEIKGKSDSLAGLVLELEGRILKIGESCRIAPYTLLVESADVRRIKRLKVSIDEK